MPICIQERRRLAASASPFATDPGRRLRTGQTPIGRRDEGRGHQRSPSLGMPTRCRHRVRCRRRGRAAAQPARGPALRCHLGEFLPLASLEVRIAEAVAEEAFDVAGRLKARREELRADCAGNAP